MVQCLTRECAFHRERYFLLRMGLFAQKRMEWIKKQKGDLIKLKRNRNNNLIYVSFLFYSLNPFLIYKSFSVFPLTNYQ